MTENTAQSSAFTAKKASGGDMAFLTKLREFSAWHTVAPPLVFFAMLLVVGVFNSNYLGPLGISIATASAAPILLVALGQSMVLNIGSIDLSNAAISLVGAILLAMTIPAFGVGAMIAVLALLTVIGAINGLILAYTHVPSFALTLGTLGILQTTALVVSGSETIYLSENRELVTTLYSAKLFYIPLTFWMGVVVAVAYWVLLRLTRVGQNMTAVGKNESGAILSAIPTKWVKVIAFAISGFTGGLAGIAIVAQAGSASASGLGSALLLPGIAAALVGGTSISGGLTNPLNVVFGALTVAFVPIAIQAIGFNAAAQSLVYGIFIIAVVTLTTTRTRGLVIK
ncbi:ABC transporter permease [Alphaproteobacteria bacterium GH1-50]|uniref:Autoinducer 2 import system permease protein LsrC n=1 Tax=Kangsaoukella pontilimi TaxID=2691042 RepID=A0A7C9IUG9_9RHOB|nr:ABC transporter permease [Kangsaoukella pontilimi]MXQ09825.1 ABC transporter permease [Kangsaoukella pontilimi]